MWKVDERQNRPKIFDVKFIIATLKNLNIIKLMIIAQSNISCVLTIEMLEQ